MNYNCTSITDPFQSSSCLYMQTKGDFIDKGSNMLVLLFILWALFQFLNLTAFALYRGAIREIKRI